ncbi:type-F conjugative transfer system protein TraW [Chachezhania sediminis]|uniref:type-F conjugative transfer system protein TraW n=1 Tax=Chachezhania sediminis TaxID=2599291 RepID=UPI00131AD61D|nr:type-F conjugative transfer system protein TraW [Chachezhania sediminis]
MRVVPFLCLVLSPPALVSAKDLGTHGPLFEIAETSLLDAIQVRLAEKEAAGDVDELRDEMQRNARAYVDRPRPVAGLGRAVERQSWTVDLSITLETDLADHRGQVFARAGTRVNPLDHSRFRKRIVLFDGDDPAQVDFALREGNELDTLLVLVNGNPLELMRQEGRRFYFDQNAVLAERFGILNVPAVVTREDPVMRVEEVPVGEDE